MGGKVMIIDIGKCTGCMSCVIACKDEHVENDWSPYSKPQPEYGHLWMRVDTRERGSIPKVKVTYIPTPCMHCDNPPCIKTCPSGAIIKRDDGIVIIDPDKCDGCKSVETEPLCIPACPYKVIYFNEELRIAQKCTFCAHLLADPEWKYGPRCYDICPVEAIIFGDEEDPKIKELIKNAGVLYPELGTKPRVYYLNLPRPFIGGCIIDPDDKEVIIKAKVIALDLYRGVRHETYTDEFGDFWLTDLEWKHKYLIKVEKEGYKEKIIGVFTTDRDINIGNIFLTKK